MHVHLKPIDVAIARAGGDTATLRVIEQCRQCRAAAHRVEEWIQLADHPDPLVAAEIEMGLLRLDTLRSLTFSQATQLLRDDPEYHRWGLTRLVLLSAKHHARRGAPAEHIWTSLELLTLGFELAARLDPGSYGEIPCIRICLQVLETGFQALSSLLEAEELDRACHQLFPRIYALLETLE